MRTSDYLRDNTPRIITHVAAMAALGIFLLATGTAPGVLCLVLVAWGLGLGVSLAVGCHRQKKQINELWAILDALPQKYLLMECAPKPKTAYQAQLYQMLRLAGKSMTEQVSASRRQMADYQEYVESWVHEIKLPLTAISLTCENNRSAVTKKIQYSLAEVEQQVERCLFYARSGGMAQDLVVQKASLADIANAALSKNRTLLIQSGVRVDCEGLDTDVYTDPKWLEFILGQLLANAVKYRSEEPVVRITANRQEGETQAVRLAVQDNGIGIPAADLPRIFQKGFTGGNGRIRSGATGMGLYLCQKLANHLQIGLSAKSVENEYTRICLVLPCGQQQT